MKKEYKCTNCKKVIYRYESTVRNSDRIFCCKKCVHEYQKYALMGKNNHMYKTGKYCNKKCACGNIKDTRSIVCATCAGKSFTCNTPKTSDGWALEVRTDEEIATAVTKFSSISEVAKYLKVSRSWLTKRIKRLELSIEHFKKCSYRPNKKENILCKNSKVTHGTLRAFILKHKIIEYICCECGQGDSWKDKTIILELHHINGNNKDNRIDNLVFLCPNCHTQTTTYRGKL